MHNWSEIIGTPAKVWRKAKEVGPFYALQLVFWQVVPHWLFDFNVWVVAITDLRDRVEITDHDPAIRWADERDIDALVSTGLDRAKITAEFAKGARIAVFERDGRVIAHHRLRIATHEQDDWLFFKCRPDDITGGVLWVAPEHRGSGIGPRMMGFTWSELARAGFPRIVAIVNVLNRNSRRALAKKRGMEKGRIYYLRLFGLAFLHYGSLNRVGCWHPRNRLEIPFAG